MERASSIAVACLALAFASAAPAQDTAPERKPVAKLKTVEGNVLVSGEAGLASGDVAMRLVEGTRVITTASAKAVVEYDDGCEVALEPNKRLEIRLDKPCRERIAQAESILKEPAGMALAAGSAGAGTAAAAALSGSLLGPGVLSGVVGVTGAATIANSRGERATSPN